MFLLEATQQGKENTSFLSAKNVPFATNMMQLFPSTVPIYMFSAMSLPFSDDTYCHLLHQQVGRYGPTVDLVTVDVTPSSAKWSHTEDCTQVIMHRPDMPHEENEIHIHKGNIKIIITNYPLCRNYSLSEQGMSCFACLIFTGGVKGILLFQPVYSSAACYITNSS